MTTELTPISAQDEMKILALLAQGKLTQQQIADQFGISQMAVSKVKSRNPDTLRILMENVTEHRLTQASRILNRTNKAIEEKLDDSEKYNDKIREIHQDFIEGSITEDERNARLRALEKLTIADLTRISHEMHTQIKGEDPDKPAALNPENAKDYLVNLAKGLEQGDEVVLERLVFRKNEP